MHDSRWEKAIRWTIPYMASQILPVYEPFTVCRIHGDLLDRRPCTRSCKKCHNPKDAGWIGQDLQGLMGRFYPVEDFLFKVWPLVISDPLEGLFSQRQARAHLAGHNRATGAFRWCALPTPAQAGIPEGLCLAVSQETERTVGSIQRTRRDRVL